MNRLEPYFPAIFKLCETHKVKTLYAFGSVLNEKFNSDSDIDLIVDFANVPVEDYADNFFDLKFSRQEILKKPIDLLEENAIRNPYLKNALDNQKQLVYG
jgi:predicted nucleotidyltransferase